MMRELEQIFSHLLCFQLFQEAKKLFRAFIFRDNLSSRGRRYIH